MNQPTVSSMTIVNKVFRDLRPNHDNWVYDAVEWIGEVIEFIGAPVTMEMATSVLAVENHRAALPMMAELKGVQILSGSTHQNMPYKMPKSATTLPVGLDNAIYPNTPGEENGYVLQHNWIMLPFETGEIQITFRRIALDDTTGFPMVPSNTEFSEASFWYILKKMLTSGYEPKQARFDFEYVDHQWKHYCRLARHKLIMPTMEEMEMIRGQWTSLLPVKNWDEMFYSHMPRNNRRIVSASNIETNPLSAVPPST